VALLRGKSQAAFTYLYKAYGNVLYGVVSKIISDEGIAEDALQEAFVKIWTHIDQYDAAKGRIYTWMLNIARNTAIDKLRSKGEIMRGKIRGDEESVNTGNAAFITTSQQATDTIGIREAVAGLEARYAQIVQLAYFQGYTLDEISNVLTVPLGTVKTRMRHALQSLRKHFSRYLYGLHQSRTAITKADECFLVEGYTDVISLHQGGVENVVASSGTSLTEEQLQAIGRLTKNLTILYDGDAAGVKAALRGLDMALGQSFNAQLVLLPEGEDPDSFVQKSGASRFHEFVAEHKQDVISFRLEVGLRDAGEDAVKRNKLVNEIAESIALINKAEDFALQGYYIKTAAGKLEVEQEGFVTLVNKYIRQRLDDEGRARRADERRSADVPADETIIGNDALNVVATPGVVPASYEEQQEWSLLKALLEWGSQPFEGYANVADLIAQRVDPELLDTPLVRQLFDEYFEQSRTHGTVPAEDYFLHHADPAVQQRMATLLHDGTGVSPNWSATYGIETFSDEAAYAFQVDSTLSYFELKKLKMLQRTIIERLGTEKDDAKQVALMRRYLALKTDEAELLKRPGTVIVKTT
jgi:DNA primase